VGFFDVLAVDRRAVAGIEIANNQGAVDLADLAMDPADPAVIKTDIGIGVSTNDRRQFIETDPNRWQKRGEAGEYDFHLYHRVDLIQIALNVFSGDVPSLRRHLESWAWPHTTPTSGSDRDYAARRSG
jgi:hypothetical protein